MTAYYNEHDGFKAEWLRELIRQNQIAQGEVDERDIKTVTASDLAGFTQCHFFAGIGVWSYALRLAGWPDDRPVWTGSCPCPGFSAAGKGGGFGDARHLWPDWFRLIRERHPANIFGEQADDAVGFGWLDLVQTDLEAADYAVGKAVFGACSVGAPHIRQRLYFGAHSDDGERADAANGNGRSGERPAQTGIGENGIGRRRPASRGADDGRSHAEQPRLEGHSGHGDGSDKSRRQLSGQAFNAGSLDGSSDTARGGLGEHWRASRHAGQADQSGEIGECIDAERNRREIRLDVHGELRGEGLGEGRPLNGFWSDAIWLPCTDGKYRPTQPGLFPLAHGAAARVGRLRGYGDAIVAQQAQAFIEAWLEIA